MVIATVKFTVSPNAPRPTYGTGTGGGGGLPSSYQPPPAIGNGDNGNGGTSGIQYQCASGFKFQNGACVQIVNPPFVCSSGYTFMSGNCLQNNLLCPPDYYWNGQVCVQTPSGGGYNVPPVAGEIMNVNISANNQAGGTASIIVTFQSNSDETNASYMVRVLVPSLGVDFTSPITTIPATGQGVISLGVAIPTGYQFSQVNGLVQLIHVVNTNQNRTDDTENITIPIVPTGTTPPPTCGTDQHIENGVCVPNTPPTAGEITNVNITPNNAPGSTVTLIMTFRHNGVDSNASYFMHATLPAAGVNISTTPINVPATGQGVLTSTFIVPAGYTFDSITGLVELVHVIAQNVNRTDDTENIVVPVQVPGAPPTSCPTGQHLEGNVCVPDVAPVAGEILNVNISPTNAPGGVVIMTTTFQHNGSESNANYFVYIIFPALGINHASDSLTVPSQGQGVIVTNMTIPTTFTGTAIQGTLQLVRQIATGINRTDDTESLTVPVTQPSTPIVCASGTVLVSGVCVPVTTSGGSTALAIFTDKSSYTKGQTIKVMGTGFEPSEQVSIRVRIAEHTTNDKTVTSTATGTIVGTLKADTKGIGYVKGEGLSSHLIARKSITIT